MQNNETFRVIWDGDSESDCVDVCRELKRAGIVYRVAQQPVSRSIRMGVDWRFQVGVLGCDYESAREALGLSAATDDNVEDQAFEIPESTYPISEPSDAADESRAAGSYLKAWHPENANVEIWSQVALDTIVTMALRENLIHYRLQPAKNGAYKLFVRPEDEARAREIAKSREVNLPGRTQVLLNQETVEVGSGEGNLAGFPTNQALTQIPVSDSSMPVSVAHFAGETTALHRTQERPFRQWSRQTDIKSLSRLANASF